MAKNSGKGRGLALASEKTRHEVAKKGGEARGRQMHEQAKERNNNK